MKSNPDRMEGKMEKSKFHFSLYGHPVPDTYIGTCGRKWISFLLSRTGNERREKTIGPVHAISAKIKKAKAIRANS